MIALAPAIAVVCVGAAVGRVAAEHARAQTRRRLGADRRGPRGSWDEAMTDRPWRRLLPTGPDSEPHVAPRIALILLSVTVVFVVGALPVLLAALSGLVIRQQLQRRAHSGALRKVVAALPVALDDLARALRSGSSLPLALGQVASTTRGPLAQDWLRIQRSLELGNRLGDAATEWAAARPCPEVRLAVSAWRLGLDAGGSLAASLAGIAETLRGRAQIAAEVRALSSQARLSGLIIGVAPVGFCLLASRADPRLAHTLFATPIGWTLLVAGVALDLAGAAWMRRLARTT